MSLTAEKWKEKGNYLYSQGHLEEAIESYSRAIICCPDVSTYYTNRALCYTKLEKWESAIIDAKKAVEIDDTSVKGHYFLGLSLLKGFKAERTTEAIKSLRKAYDLGLTQHVPFVSDISRLLMEAKKLKWNKDDLMYRREKNELHVFLHKLVTKHFEQLKNEGQDVDYSCERWLSQLETLFSQIDENSKARNVPDYLCGKITLNLMQDPVITPSGITYDRDEIKQHLRSNGQFDPFTRKKLTEKDLIPNLALREALEEFTTKNGWALDF